MEPENILLSTQNHVATLTINHPPANAWNLATMLEMEAALDRVEGDKNIRVLIITGQGEKCFSAGFDVSDAANAGVIAPLGRKLWRRIDRFEKPVIAAINGFALGGGFELVLACHFRFMVDAPKATLGLTELNLGIIPGWGGTQRLAAVVGKAKALDMIFFSRKVEAQKAYEMGLVNQVCTPESLLSDALSFAEELSKRPPIAVSCVLKALSAGAYEGIDQGLSVEAEGSDKVATTMDCIEGFTAFFEKREPKFKGE